MVLHGLVNMLRTINRGHCLFSWSIIHEPLPLHFFLFFSSTTTPTEGTIHHRELPPSFIVPHIFEDQHHPRPPCHLLPPPPSRRSLPDRKETAAVLPWISIPHRRHHPCPHLIYYFLWCCLSLSLKFLLSFVVLF